MQRAAVMARPTLLVFFLWALLGLVASADDSETTQLEVNPVSNTSGVNFNESKIVGAQVSPVRHQWLAGLYYIPNQNDRRYIRYACTVSIFTPKMGLTSGHCFDATMGNFFELFFWRVKWDSDEAYRGKDAEIIQLIRHPQYTKSVRAANGRMNAGSHDVAAMVFRNALALTELAHLVGIAPGFFQSAGFLFGMGRTDPAKAPNPGDKVRMSPVHVTANSDCAFGNTFDPTAVCWRTTDNSRPCNGDSGGPVMFYENNAQLTQFVVGLMTYGAAGCTSIHFAATSLQDLAMHDWVQEQITAHS